jgi:hypothetical protein
VITCRPREPLVIANGTSPTERSRSPVARAAARTSAKSVPSGGSKSKISRSGFSRSSARAGQKCGVMQF